jgi:hypothetical protein
VLPKSSAPKKSPICATFAPIVTQDTWTVGTSGRRIRDKASTRRYPTAWPNPEAAASPKRGSRDNSVFPDWNIQGMNAVNPPVSPWSARTRSRWLTIAPGVSTLPNIIVAEVRSPWRCASRITAAHCSHPIFLGLILRRTSSSRISAPPPGIESRPASLRRAITSPIVSPDWWAKWQISGGEKPWSRIGWRLTARTRRTASSIPQSGCKPPCNSTRTPPAAIVSTILAESSSSDKT